MTNNKHNESTIVGSVPTSMNGKPLHTFSSHTGRPFGSSNFHAKARSALSRHLKTLGVDWIASLAVAIKSNDKQLLNIWLRLLPYLLVTGNKERAKKFRIKGKASKAALEALNQLEKNDRRVI